MKAYRQRLTSVYNGSNAHTRRGPEKSSPPEAKRVFVRPNNFVEWWAWGLEQAESATDIPLRLHDRHRPPPLQPATTRDPVTKTRLSKRRDQIIMGQPFAVPFEKRLDAPRMAESFVRHLDGKYAASPMKAAMASLYNPRGPAQAHEYRILFALISGHTDPEVVRAVGLGGPRRDFFESAAIRALEFVWEKAHDQLNQVKDPPAPAGVA